jgi:aminopeptidase N
MQEPTRTFRKDHSPPPFLIPFVSLVFDLDATQTSVTTTLDIQPNPQAKDEHTSIKLDGEKLEVIDLSVNGKTLAPTDYHYDGAILEIFNVTAPVEITTKIAINVDQNASMIGLGLSKDGDIVSQCEAEGMRRVTFMLDRPDILSVYEVTMKADQKLYPTLLSNGHKIASGTLSDGRHWARWHDPIPKPGFIFCIIAGQLSQTLRSYETGDGRLIELGLYVREEYRETCLTALDFVVEAMAWDEKVFGRFYDLSVFNICVLNGALGAMENKGLNLFDLAWAVVHPSNTSDDEYEYRLKSIGHEYFHNWSGNRVTIANWFQTSLKEGLTRFRDQLFLGDLTEFSAVRIRMAQHIRNNQFTEDNSGIAHPPILESYSDTRNNYSVTVYDKGQEIIFMLYNLIGRTKFEQIISAYFDTYASQAVTIEEFLGMFEKLGGLDLTQFRRWYYQGGLTSVTATSQYDPLARRFSVTLAQETVPTPDQATKLPHHIPFALGLVSRTGREIVSKLEGFKPNAQGTYVLELKQSTQNFVFKDVAEPPVLSLLRGFSAPVVIKSDQTEDDLAVLIRHDSDSFARWDGVQRFATHIVTAFAKTRNAGEAYEIDERFTSALESTLRDPSISPRLMSEMLTLPDERTLGEEGDIIDVDGVHLGREAILDAFASRAQSTLWEVVQTNSDLDDDTRDNQSVGRRKLKMKALEYLARMPEPAAREHCLKILTDGKNFTEQVSALSILVEGGGVWSDQALDAFAQRHEKDQLAKDHWYRAQLTAKREDTAARVEALMEAPDFDPAFSRIFTFCDQFFYKNRYGLHAPGFQGYGVFQRQMIKLDARIPMLAGWTLQRSDFTRWWKFDPVRAAHMRQVLEAISKTDGIGEGCLEVATNALNAGQEALVSS